MNTFLLISTIFNAFSGFVIALYGTLSKTMIETETNIGSQKGIDFFSDEGANYYAKRYEKWNAGSFFLTNTALILGFIFVLIAMLLNLAKNPLWSSLIVLVVGYILYLFLAKIFASKIQLISIFLLIFSLSFSIYLIS